MTEDEGPTYEAPPQAPDKDVLGRPEPRSTLRRALLGTAAAVAAVGVAGTAWAAASFLSGGGAQPEDVLPAGTLAVAKVDLDPAAGQKLAVFRLAQRFPSVRDDVSGADDVRDELLRALFEDVPDVDYDRDIASWVGDRAAVAAIPGPDGPQPLVVVAHTDRAAAEQSLERLALEDDQAFWAFSEQADYVLLGQSQQVVDAAAGTSDVLADDGSYRDDVDALDGDQVVTVWADLGAVWEVLPEELRQAAGEGVGYEGRLAVGAHATPDGMEVVGRAVGLSTGAPGSETVGVRAGTGMVADLPADAVAAVGITDLGDGVAGMVEQLSAVSDPLGITALAEQSGIALPEDLQVLLGEETVGALLGPEDAAARSRTDDPDRALEVVELLVAAADASQRASEQELAAEEPYLEEEYREEPYLEEEYLEAPPAPGTAPALPPPPAAVPALLPSDDTTVGAVGASLVELPADKLRRLDDGIAVGTSARAVERVAQGDGGLGRSPAFRRAVSDGDAGFVLFVDVARTAEAFGPANLGADAEAVEAVGLSATGGPDGSFVLRVTVR